MPLTETNENRLGIPSDEVEGDEQHEAEADSGEQHKAESDEQHKAERDEQHKADRDGSMAESSLSVKISSDEISSVSDHLDVETSTIETLASTISGDTQSEEISDFPAKNPPNADTNIDAVTADFPVDSNQNTNSSNENMMSGHVGSPRSTDLSESLPLQEDAPTKSDMQSKDLDIVVVLPDTGNKQPKEQKVATSAEKVQEQLDEVKHKSRRIFFIYP